jgi:hypothetical protein
VRRRVRTAVAGFAAATLLLAAVPAGAADVPYAATADAAGVSISLAGDTLVAGASTETTLQPGEATALAIPLIVAGQPIVSAEATSTGDLDEDDVCVSTAGLPVPVELDVLCAEAWADVDEGYAGAVAEGVALELSLDAEAAAPLLELLGELDLDRRFQEALGELPGDVASLRGELEDTVEDTVLELRDACFEELDGLDLIDLLLDPDSLLEFQALVEQLEDAPPGELRGIIGQLEDGLTSLPEPCEVLAQLLDGLLALLGDLSGIDVGLGSAVLRDLIAEAGIELAVVVTETWSGAADTGDEVYAESELALAAIVLDVDLLGAITRLVDELLAPLDEAVEELLDLAAAFEDLLDDELELVELVELPATDDVLSEALGADLLGLLGSEDALLEAVVFSGGAWVTYDREGDEFDADFEAGELELDGTLFSLPFADEVSAELEALLGDVVDAVDLAESPLAGILAVDLGGGSIDEEATVFDLDGVEATSSGVSVAVLGALGEEALLQVDVLSATAAVGVGEAEVVTPPVQPADGTPTLPAPGPGDDAPRKGTLPDTGGGAALLGLAAIGAAAALRRRAD